MISRELLPALLIDATGQSSWVGLATLAERVELSGTGRSSALVAQLSTELLERYHLSYNELSSIIVLTGPGSYTGIRSSLAFCKGIELATAVRCVGVGVFQAASALLREQPGNYVLRLSANRNEDFILSIQVRPDCTIYSDWALSVVATKSLEDELLAPLSGRLDTPTVISLDPELGPLAKGRMEALLRAASDIQLQGPFEPYYGKAVSAKTLAERGLGGTFTP